MGTKSFAKPNLDRKNSEVIFNSKFNKMELLKREIVPKMLKTTGWDNELMVQRENHDYLFTRKNLLFIQDFT